MGVLHPVVIFMFLVTKTKYYNKSIEQYMDYGHPMNIFNDIPNFVAWEDKLNQ